jgi:hypothetical protein
VRALVPFFVLALTATAGAQTPAPVGTGSAVVGRVIAKARETNTLTRVLGERHFRLEKGGEQAVLTIRVRADAADATLLVSEMELHGGTLAMTTAFTQAAAGDIRRVHVTANDGTTNAEMNAEAKDGKLSGHESQNGQPGGPVEIALTPDLVAFPVAFFVLPCLFDQGLPDGLGMHVFEGEGDPKQSVLHVIAAPETTPQGAVRVVILDAGGDERIQVRVRADGAHAGEIVSIKSGDSEEVMTPITADEAARIAAQHH